MKRKMFVLIALFVASLMTATLAKADSAQGGTLTRTRVQANGADRFDPIVFYAGQMAYVEVDGDGYTNLDLYVYDQAGRLIAMDDDNLDYCFVSWVPSVTQAYTIRIVNRGNVYNEYIMRTN